MLGALPAGSSGALEAAAATSGRPPECTPARGAAAWRGPSVWRAARLPWLEGYCDLLAKAQAELSSAPETARTAALGAEKLLPGRASPAAMQARAALALGDLEEASRLFERARSLDPRAIEYPPAMHDLARVLVRTGKRVDALALYRTLVPRVDLLAPPERRTAVLIEAAHAMMDADADGEKDRRSRLEEAIAYLREARRRPPTPLAGDALFSLGLALDRAGDKAGADAILVEARLVGARLQREPRSYVLGPNTKLALEAFADEAENSARAARSWETYLATPAARGLDAAAARLRLQALRKPAVSLRPAAQRPRPPRRSTRP